jgi:hypothetical protein
VADFIYPPTHNVTEMALRRPGRERRLACFDKDHAEGAHEAARE